MRLQDIGFYTLSDERADRASSRGGVSRLEMLLGDRCNFNCPYCRHSGGADMTAEDGFAVLEECSRDGLFAVRFSGGEPTMNPWLDLLVGRARAVGAERIAVSTNGSADFPVYSRLLGLGVNDFSVSLDACCASDGDMMAGCHGVWDRVVENIRLCSSLCYTTVGVVLTAGNIGKINDIISFASSLGVADVRVIPAAQDGDRLSSVSVDADILARHPILRYRVGNIKAGVPVRGLSGDDSRRCGLVVDDVAVASDGMHYPCVIYLREGGGPIGRVGPGMMSEREEWSRNHDTFNDPICRGNCLDCLVQYNRRYASRNPGAAGPAVVHMEPVASRVTR